STGSSAEGMPRAQARRARERASTRPTMEGSNPRARTCMRACRAVSACTTPETMRPAESRASYWNASMLFPGNPDDLLQADHPLHGPAHAIVAQRAHAVRGSVLAQHVLRGAVVDQPAEVVIERQQ